MAFKPIPQQENRKKLRVPLQGSYTLTSSPHSFTNSFVQGCRYVNCFPVEIPQFGGDPIKILNKAPGFDTSPQTLTLTANGWNLYGSIVQYFDADGLYVATLGGANPIYIGRFDVSGQIIPLVTDGNENITSALAKVYNQAATSVQPYYGYITQTSNGFTLNLLNFTAGTVGSNTYVVAIGCVTAVPPIYLNDRMFFLDVATGLIYNTDPINGASMTYTVGNFIAPQLVADRYFGMVKYRNHLCVIGQQSIEFFYDAGISISSPLARQEQYLIRHGCSSISNVVMYGDVMYFLGYTEIQGWGLYEVAEFRLRKVSPPGIDAIINNVDDFAGQSAPNAEINLVDIFGHACLLIKLSTYTRTNPVELVFEIPKRPYGIMAPTDGQWWEWPAMSSITQTFAHNGFFIWGGTNTSFCNYPLIFHTIPTNTTSSNAFAANHGTLVTSFNNTTPYNSIPASFYFTYPSNTTAVPVFISKNRAVSSSVTATMITDVMDFEENMWKHIDYIDCLGDFGNNTVTLSWTSDPTYQTANWVQASTKSQSVNGPKNEIRWHNPGPFRTVALRYDFTGTSNIVYKGTEVSLNVGTI